MTRMEGTVKWFSAEKGFGFITRDDGSDVFVHHTAIQSRGFRTLDEGERVEFEIMEEPKGLRACHVVRLNAPVVDEAELRERTSAPARADARVAPARSALEAPAHGAFDRAAPHPPRDGDGDRQRRRRWEDRHDRRRYDDDAGHGRGWNHHRRDGDEDW